MEGCTDVEIKLAVLDRQNGCRVRIIEDILYPAEFQLVQIKAHQMSAIVSDKKVPLVYGGAVLHPEPVGATSVSLAFVAPLYYATGLYGDLAFFLVVLCVQLYQIEYSVLAGLYQSIRLGVYKL